MIRYYIVQWSDWKPGNWRPISGPFASKSLATLATAEFKQHKTSGRDILRADVFTRTWLSLNGGYPKTRKGNASLARDVLRHRQEWASRTQSLPIVDPSSKP